MQRYCPLLQSNRLAALVENMLGMASLAGASHDCRAGRSRKGRDGTEVSVSSFVVEGNFGDPRQARQVRVSATVPRTAPKDNIIQVNLSSD